MTSGAAARKIELVRRAIAVIEAGDLDALDRFANEVADEEIEWVPLVTSVDGASYNGRDGLRRFFGAGLAKESV